MRGIKGIDPGWGVTAVRVAVACVLIYNGWLKWFVWGVDTGVTQIMMKYGLPLPVACAYLVATAELVGGLALLVGLVARWLGLYFTLQFLVVFAVAKLRPPASFARSELELMILAAAILILLAGPGRAAVDGLWLEKE